MKLIGKSPISAPILILGKAAMVSSWIFFIVKLMGIDRMIYDHPLLSSVGIALFLIGAFFITSGIINLGDSISVGLREDETRLKTHGIYTLTRNPIYFGAFLMCIGSNLYALHIINIILLLITIIVHHSIILKEEQFLEKRFGREWIQYKTQVFRYIGGTKK